MTSSKCEIVPMRDVLWHSCLRKARWDVGVVTGVYCPPGIAARTSLWGLYHEGRSDSAAEVSGSGRLRGESPVARPPMCTERGIRGIILGLRVSKKLLSDTLHAHLPFCRLMQ